MAALFGNAEFVLELLEAPPFIKALRLGSCRAAIPRATCHDLIPLVIRESMTRSLVLPKNPESSGLQGVLE